MAKVEDLWTNIQKSSFNTDGSYKLDVKQRLLSMGANPHTLAENEAEMRQKIQEHLEKDSKGADQWGKFWSDYQLESRVQPPSVKYQIPLEQSIEFNDSSIS